ncbi:microcin ABC transporter ATP-binding protein, partial [Pantoea agglomerans]|nr:microcin ABC transporter ATP-binding protein [Pantoea agglomerans]
ITHNLNIVRQLADNVSVMRNGHIVEQNRCQTLLNQPQHPYGQPLHQLSRRQLLPLRQRIQVVFQDPNSSLNPRMTVQQI